METGMAQAVSDYAIVMLDPTGRVTSWNAGARGFRVHQANEVVCEGFSRFYAAEERDAGVPLSALETAKREGRFETDAWRVRKDGSRFWDNIVIDPVHDANAALVGFAQVIRDLT